MILDDSFAVHPLGPAPPQINDRQIQSPHLLTEWRRAQQQTPWTASRASDLAPRRRAAALAPLHSGFVGRVEPVPGPDQIAMDSWVTAAATRLLGGASTASS